MNTGVINGLANRVGQRMVTDAPPGSSIAGFSTPGSLADPGEAEWDLSKTRPRRRQSLERQMAKFHRINQ
jgi:hypothetical protein